MVEILGSSVKRNVEYEPVKLLEVMRDVRAGIAHDDGGPYYPFLI